MPYLSGAIVALTLHVSEVSRRSIALSVGTIVNWQSVHIRDYEDDPSIHGGIHHREKGGNNLVAAGNNGVDGGHTV